MKKSQWDICYANTSGPKAKKYAVAGEININIQDGNFFRE